MDEHEYRDTYKSVNERFCPFEKSILTRQCDCEHSRRFNIADREGAGCRSAAAQKRCLVLLPALRRKAQFSLRMTNAVGALPHAKEMKVQVGGLLGLQRLLFPEKETTRVDNIHGLITAAVITYEDLDKLPFQEIIKSIVSYRGKRRKSSRQDG